LGDARGQFQNGCGRHTDSYGHGYSHRDGVAYAYRYGNRQPEPNVDCNRHGNCNRDSYRYDDAGLQPDRLCRDWGWSYSGRGKWRVRRAAGYQLCGGRAIVTADGCVSRCDADSHLGRRP
jgi:hypothetical protein